MKQLLLINEDKCFDPDGDLEIWVNCPGFDRYEVSSTGQFRIKETGYRMAQNKEINGYPIVMLTKNGRQSCYLAHRLICMAFHGPSPTGKPLVNHKNRDKCDNRASNLEWVSRSGNAKHWRSCDG